MSSFNSFQQNSPIMAPNGHPQSSSSSSSPFCVVCAGPTNGIWHYGVECCRACASFFHRSMKDGRKYVCRGQQNCLISNDVGLRNSCRFCRLKRCIEVGMVLDEPKKKDKKAENQRLPSIPDHSRPMPISYSAASISPQHYSPITNFPSPGSPIEARIPITLEFDQSIRQFNHGLKAVSIVEGISVEFAGAENHFKLLTHEEFRRSMKSQILLVYAMIRDYFPAINQFPMETKFKLLRSFGKQFCMLNKSQMTINTFQDPDSPYAVMIPGGVLDITIMHQMLADEIADPENREKFIKSFCHRHFNFCRYRFRPLNISSLEFSALAALTFWNNVEQTASEFVPSEVYTSKRDALYVELSTIIGDRLRGEFCDPSSAAVRFGRLMDLLHQLAIFTLEVTEVAAMAKIFMDVSDFWEEITLPI